MTDSTDRFYGRPHGLSSRQARRMTIALVAGALVLGLALGLASAHGAPAHARTQPPAAIVCLR